jgi:para-nitrobenzyl esterase
MRAAPVYVRGDDDLRLAATPQRRMTMSNCQRRTAVAGALCLIAAGSWAKPTVIESGTIEGVAQGALTVYAGVPFAAPPVGELRWRDPQPVVPWKGARKAISFAPACLQKGVSMPGEKPPATSEDCLYLNIWSPAKTADERLPVMVWIHGGGYKNGSASMPLYRGDKLAQHGVVVVTIVYRLGPLGFLAHPQLTAESSKKSSGNYGLRARTVSARPAGRSGGSAIALAC